MTVSLANQRKLIDVFEWIVEKENKESGKIASSIFKFVIRNIAYHYLCINYVFLS